MPTKRHRKAAFVSSFLPRKCGIATFCSDLINNISLSGGRDFEPLVAAMVNSPDDVYSSPVKFEIRRNIKNDYISAAAYLNFSDVDVISVQHEFGLFGGNAGSYLNSLLKRVNAPIISTLHTVLDEPSEDYYQSCIDVCNYSEKVIVMNERGVNMLKDIYNVDESKIILIPHGIPDLSFVDSSYYKHKFGMDGRKTVLTFGLIGRGKGIENVIKALPKVVQKFPSLLYIVLGMTHPEVKKNEGESYRYELQRLVKELGVQENVIFHNRFVRDDELHNFLCASDIYITPYMNREQLTSGTLAYAVGTGKAVISTPYWAAEELLSDGRGMLVQFGNPNSIADAMLKILSDDILFNDLRRKAYEYGRGIAWNVIGSKYWDLFLQQRSIVSSVSKISQLESKELSLIELPEPPLEHLKRLTDDTGLFQHSKLTIPDRNHGYCTDDNARAVVVLSKYLGQYSDADAQRLFEIYLSFIMHAQTEDGYVKNFMSYDRKWVNGEPDHDAIGRTLWGFGSVIANPPSPWHLSMIKECFDRSIKHIPQASPRVMAYAILGMANYLKQFPGASEIKRMMIAASERLIKLYNIQSNPQWQWFEPVLAYDNAVLSTALFISTNFGGGQKHLEIALKTCDFLTENTFNGEHFSFVGCKGWYRDGSKKAQFDQQPIEAAGAVLLFNAAFEATGDKKYLRLQRKAFDWFLGENDLHIPLYNFRSKGCFDGLEPTGVNLNQGAESLLSFLIALLTVLESQSAASETTINEK